MTDHPITPPPELLQQIADGLGTWLEKMSKAYCAGADQELEAVDEWLKAKEWIRPEFSDELRAARRPKPPSLAEKALEALEVEDDAWPVKSLEKGERFDLIRRALERLQELEDG